MQESSREIYYPELSDGEIEEKITRLSQNQNNKFAEYVASGLSRRNSYFMAKSFPSEEVKS